MRKKVWVKASVFGVQSPCLEQITSITSTQLSSGGLSIGVTIMNELGRLITSVNVFPEFALGGSEPR